MVQKESSKKGPINKIRKFANRSLNADSDMDDIAEYRRELDAIISDVQVCTIKETLTRANVLH